MKVGVVLARQLEGLGYDVDVSCGGGGRGVGGGGDGGKVVENDGRGSGGDGLDVLRGGTGFERGFGDDDGDGEGRVVS